jgi:6-pyruvoyltetrahydropterin/6-carboxytetrahydropterin synthase
MFRVTKTYPHSLGLSACFRQPGAKSHCHDPHGYPLEFRLTFEASALDENNWVLDFGGLKPIKAWLADNFDHRTILAANDPFLSAFQVLYRVAGFREILVLPFVGCEGFAEYVSKHVQKWLEDEHGDAIRQRGLRLVSVECREHGGNSALYSERGF